MCVRCVFMCKDGDLVANICSDHNYTLIGIISNNSIARPDKLCKRTQYKDIKCQKRNIFNFLLL